MLDHRISDKWPLWFRLGPSESREVLTLTRDDVQFLLNGFNETYSGYGEKDFEEERYQKFCATFHGYHWVAKNHHNAANAVVLLGAVADQVRTRCPRVWTASDSATDSINQMKENCTVAEIRATMFYLWRALRHTDPAGDLLAEHPELRLMAAAILELLDASDNNV